VLAELAGPSDAGEDVGDAEEVVNDMRAMRHGLRSKLPISLRLIRELHGVLMKGVRGGQDRPGEFRDVQSFVGSPGASIGDARMDLLLAVSQKGAWLEWVRFFLKGVEESASESLAQTDTLLALRERYHNQFRPARSFGVLREVTGRKRDQVFVAHEILKFMGKR